MGMCQGCKEVFNTNDMINGYCNDCVKKQYWYTRRLANESEKTAEDNGALDFLDKAERVITKFGMRKKIDDTEDGYARWLADEEADAANRALERAMDTFGITKLKNWYYDINDRQRIIVWVISVLITATNPIGWIFFVWWWLPLLTYLEYNRP